MLEWYLYSYKLKLRERGVNVKKVYSAPKITASEFAQFENVYTGGCHKSYGGQSWRDCPHGDAVCYYSDGIHPSDSCHTCAHTNVMGS